jgi:hypothetical protein
MLALKNFMKIPLFLDGKFSMRHMWEDMLNITKYQQINNNHKTSQDIKMNIEQDPLNKIEEIFENVTTNSLMQFFILTDQIINDENIIIIGPHQDYKPYGLFQDPNNKECNYPTLFLRMFRKPSILAKIRYQYIAQWGLMHKEHCFARHIPNIFFLTIKVLIQQVKSTSWIRIQKGKLNDHILTTKEIITNKPNFDKLLWLDLGYCDLTHLRTSLNYLEKL